MIDNAWLLPVLSDLEKASRKEGLTKTASFLRLAQGTAIAEIMWNSEIWRASDEHDTISVAEDVGSGVGH